MRLGLFHMFLLGIVTANHRMSFLTAVFCPTSAPPLMDSSSHESNMPYFQSVICYQSCFTSEMDVVGFWCPQI
jgi:hypothetical protein